MSKKFPLKTSLLGLGVTLALGLLIIVTTFFVSNLNNKQNLRSRATVTGGPSSVLFFDPSSVSLQPSQTTTVTLNINPVNNQVFGIQLALNFDPAKIKIISVTPSSFFSNALVSPQINNASGTVNAVLTVPFPTQPTDPNAAGIPPSPVTLPNTAVATITFQALLEGSAVLSFTSDTVVVAKDESANVLASGTPLTVNVITPTLTPTNTPIPTVTSTPTSTPVPTAEPTVTPTSTPVVTATPTPTLEPGVTATPTPIPVNLTLKIKLQRITVKRPDVPVVVAVTDASGQSVLSNTYTFSSDDNGVYSGTIPGLPVGSFNIKLKPQTFLAKKFTGQNLTAGDMTLDFSAAPFLAGDIVGENNTIDIFDYGHVVEDFGPKMPASGSTADMDKNGSVDIFDYGLIIENFGKSGDN